jgi:hypothetical protein
MNDAIPTGSLTTTTVAGNIFPFDTANAWAKPASMPRSDHWQLIEQRTGRFDHRVVQVRGDPPTRALVDDGRHGIRNTGLGRLVLQSEALRPNRRCATSGV